MISVPGARGGLGVYVRLQVPQHNPSAFHRCGTRCPPFFGYSIPKTNSPFVFGTSLLSLSTPADIPIPQVSRRGTDCKRCGEASWLAALLCPTHSRVNQAVMLTLIVLQIV